MMTGASGFIGLIFLALLLFIFFLLVLTFLMPLFVWRIRDESIRTNLLLERIAVSLEDMNKRDKDMKRDHDRTGRHKAVSPQPTTPSSPTEWGRVVTIQQPVSLKESPDDNAKSVGKYMPGQHVKIDGEENGWYRAYHINEEKNDPSCSRGWVNGRYLNA